MFTVWARVGYKQRRNAHRLREMPQFVVEQRKDREKMSKMWILKIVFCVGVGYGGMWYVVGEYHKETERIVKQLERLEKAREVRFVNWPVVNKK